MKEIIVRRYKPGDEVEICNIVRKDVLTENIKDYPKVEIDALIESHNEDLIIRRAKALHVYVLVDNQKIPRKSCCLDILTKYMENYRHLLAYSPSQLKPRE